MRRSIHKETTSRAPILFPVHVVILAGIGVFEYFAAPGVSMLLFYVTVTAAASWSIGKKWGTATGAVAAAVELAVRAAAGTDAPLSLAWDVLTILIVCVAVARLVFYTRRHIEAERDLIRKDYLTGIDNIRSFYEDGVLEMERCRRARVPLTIVYMDIDDLESLNDALGHRVGDRALQSVAATLKDSLRITDIVARIGGDEFAILLPGGDYSQSTTVIRRLQSAVTGVLAGKKWPITVTTAAITYLSIPDSIDHLIKGVEESMTIVKQSTDDPVRHTVITKLQLIVGDEQRHQGR